MFVIKFVRTGARILYDLGYWYGTVRGMDITRLSVGSKEGLAMFDLF
jgi:hypothetical protein